MESTQNTQPTQAPAQQEPEKFIVPSEVSSIDSAGTVVLVAGVFLAIVVGVMKIVTTREVGIYSPRIVQDFNPVAVIYAAAIVFASIFASFTLRGIALVAKYQAEANFNAKKVAQSVHNESNEIANN